MSGSAEVGAANKKCNHNEKGDDDYNNAIACGLDIT